MTMLRLDHLTVVAPSLAEGVAHVRACLGIDMPYGGTHPEMGTHNHLVGLGHAYLEVIAIDPDAPPPSGPRWFGLGAPEAVRSAWAGGRRLGGWVARTDDIDAVLGAHGERLGRSTWISRGGKRSRFSLLPDGRLPLGGVLPSVIDRGGRAPPAPCMPDHGARLRAFVLEHPSPAEVTALYERLGIVDPPRVEAGPVPRYRATIDTPDGERTLL